MTASLSDLRGLLSWAPDALVAIIILSTAALAGFVLHAAVLIIVTRLLARRHHSHLLEFVARTRGVTLMAVLVFAIALALPVAPLSGGTADLIEKALAVAIIVLIGWAALTAVGLASSVYLQQFQLDSEDNFLARKHVTQVRILRRAAETLIVVVTIAVALMTFEQVRNFGISLFASAGVAGLLVGLAARPLFANLLAGIQIATAQPIRLDDSVMVENEFGRIEDITSTYVVVRLWDNRRMIVPLSYFIEKPFQNWTRDSTSLIGSVTFYVDFATPIARVREKALDIVKSSKLWDGKTAALQVIDANQSAIELRVLASARSGDAFDLRCEVRERLIEFLQRELPSALPRVRSEPGVSAGAVSPAQGQKPLQTATEPRP